MTFWHDILIAILPGIFLALWYLWQLRKFCVKWKDEIKAWDDRRYAGYYNHIDDEFRDDCIVAQFLGGGIFKWKDVVTSFFFCLLPVFSHIVIIYSIFDAGARLFKRSTTFWHESPASYFSRDKK